MDKDPKIIVDGGEENKNMTSLADEPSYEEHMAKKVENKTTEKNKNLIVAAVKSIAGKMGVNESELENAVFKGGDEQIFEEIRKKVAEEYNEDFVDTEFSHENGVVPERNKEQLVLEVLADMHDQWCKDNESEFFDEEKADKRYRFLKFDLIGFKDAIADLDSVRPIFEKIGIDLDSSLDPELGDMGSRLEDQYSCYPYGHDDSFTLFDDYTDNGGDESWLVPGCYFAEELYNKPSKYLSDGCSEKVSSMISGSFTIAAEITMQVGEEHNDVADESDWGALWTYHLKGEDAMMDYCLGSYDPFEEEVEDDPYFTSSEYINDGWD